MAEELYKIPFIWGVRFFSLFSGKLSFWQKLWRYCPAESPWRLIQMTLFVGTRDGPVSFSGTQSRDAGRLCILDMRILASHSHWAAATSLHLKFWTRQRGNGLSPQRLEAATRAPWGHLQTWTPSASPGAHCCQWGSQAASFSAVIFLQRAENYIRLLENCV